MNAKNSGSRYLLLTCVTIALAVSQAPVASFTFGLFIKPLSGEFGWDRASVSGVYGLAALVVGLVLPLSGALVDRYGAFKTLAPAVLLFGLLVASLSLTISLLTFAATYVAIALIGSVNTPVSYLGAISGAFGRRRGFALGVAMTGVGLGSALIPVYAQWLIDSYSWRTAYVGLGLLPIAIALPVIFVGLRPLRSNAISGSPKQGSGCTLKEAASRRTFWLLGLAVFLSSTALHGVMVHLAPLLNDAGTEPREAAKMVSILGAASIAGRLLTGPLLDKAPARFVAAVVFLLAIPGVLMLKGSVAPSLAAASIGLAVGAEIDLLAYMTSRYFGLAFFSRVYGSLLTFFVFGTAAGSYSMGATFETFRNYNPALSAFAALLTAAATAVLCTGPYNYSLDGEMKRT